VKRPAIIAHRGASAYLPEHSRGAKALAYAMGADYLEQDVIATRDGELVVLHDLELDTLSDVAERFPGRQRDDGRFYCLDFDLAELRQLRFHERIDIDTGAARYPRRYPPRAGAFRIWTLAEEIEFVDALNRSTGREVGIYPEIKNPEWHREQGFDLGNAIVDVLEAHGYTQPGRRIYLQCFEPAPLRAARERVGPDLPMIQLISSRTGVTAAQLADVPAYADGIGPSLKLVCRGRDGADVPVVTNLVADAQALGLVVHPYTLRADDLPDGYESLEALLDVLVGGLGVDGLFTDFTDRVSGYLAATAVKKRL